MLFEESVFIFQFLNNKMHNYVLFAIIVHFNIQKLKNKHTFIQTEKAKSSHFDRTRGDKKQIFPTKSPLSPPSNVVPAMYYLCDLSDNNDFFSFLSCVVHVISQGSI